MKTRKKTLKALTLSMALAALMLLPLTMNAQYKEDQFGLQEWGRTSLLGKEGGGSPDISNQTYGSDADGFGITNQTYGDTPLGSGLLIMAVAGACYAGMKRNKKQTKR